jgi:hypothetical protein
MIVVYLSAIPLTILLYCNEESGHVRISVSI